MTEHYKSPAEAERDAQTTISGPDWTVGPSGASNTSEPFRNLVTLINRLIRSAGADLIQGRSEAVANLIAAQIAHVLKMGPIEPPGPRGVAVVINMGAAPIRVGGQTGVLIAPGSTLHLDTPVVSLGAEAMVPINPPPVEVRRSRIAHVAVAIEARLERIAVLDDADECRDDLALDLARIALDEATKGAK